MSGSLDRYSRQLLLPQIGEAGQARLRDGAAVVIGCGALGTHVVELLARAGVGTIRVVDRDIVQLDNLQRQVLFDERDATRSIPKAAAAARRLRAINSTVTVDDRVVDLTPANVEELIAGADVVLDGTDNLETRYVVNDACVKAGIPWIYAGVIGTSGMTLTVRPGLGPCLRCLFPEPAPPGTLPTCDTAGILNTVPPVLAAYEVTEALRMLVREPPAGSALLHLDLWDRTTTRLEVKRNEQCPCCVARDFEYLDADDPGRITTLCGRNSVQISPASPASLDLAALGRRLSRVARVVDNGLLLQVVVDDLQLMVFPDGRVLVQGTSDEARARAVVARYIGS